MIAARAMKTLNIIGAGRAGRVLAALWHRQHTFAILDVFNRTPHSARDAVAFIGEPATEHLGGATTRAFTVGRGQQVAVLSAGHEESERDLLRRRGGIDGRGAMHLVCGRRVLLAGSDGAEHHERDEQASVHARPSSSCSVAGHGRLVCDFLMVSHRVEAPAELPARTTGRARERKRQRRPVIEVAQHLVAARVARAHRRPLREAVHVGGDGGGLDADA